MIGHFLVMKKKIYLFLFLLGTCVSPVYSSTVINTDEAQFFQREFDEKYFEINKDFEKLRHILLHLVKTTGKMATYCEIEEHGKVEADSSQLVNEVLPDLLIHALQIANHYDIDLGEKYTERIQSIINRSTHSRNIENQ